jgi:nicotinamide-nucleotide amidase
MAATAESCTGGGIAAALTDLAGSSAWFDAGFITYSNAAKQRMLGVSPEHFRESGPGAVSEAVVLEMSLGAVARSGADVSMAVSGVAGPGGGSPEKPVGTVWIAWCVEGKADAECFLFGGDRAQIRYATICAALQGLVNRVDALA